MYRKKERKKNCLLVKNKKTCKNTHTNNNTKHQMVATQLYAVTRECHSAGFQWHQEYKTYTMLNKNM
jgi:hypothetical protein